jgi:hypothetical protein
VGAAGNSGDTDALAPAAAVGTAAAAGDGTGIAVNGVLVFMNTETVMLAARFFHAALGAAAAAPAAPATALSGAPGASDNVVTTVDRASLCKAAVNCWIWK